MISHQYLQQVSTFPAPISTNSSHSGSGGSSSNQLGSWLVGELPFRRNHHDTLQPPTRALDSPHIRHPAQNSQPDHQSPVALQNFEAQSRSPSPTFSNTESGSFSLVGYAIPPFDPTQEVYSDHHSNSDSLEIRYCSGSSAISHTGSRVVGRNIVHTNGAHVCNPNFQNTFGFDGMIVEDIFDRPWECLQSQEASPTSIVNPVNSNTEQLVRGIGSGVCDENLLGELNEDHYFDFLSDTYPSISGRNEVSHTGAWVQFDNCGDTSIHYLEQTPIPCTIQTLQGPLTNFEVPSKSLQKAKSRQILSSATLSEVAEPKM